MSKITYLLVLIVSFVLSLGQANASKGPIDTNQTHNLKKESSTIGTELRTIKRTLIWLKPQNLNEKFPSIVEEEYGAMNMKKGEPVKFNAAFFKSYLDIVYAIVAADGELSQEEEYNVSQRIKGAESRLNSEEYKQVIDYNAQCIAKARAGGYKDINITPLIEKHIADKKDLGYTTEDSFQRTARIVLLDAIMAARTDGFSEEERNTAKQVSNKMGVPTEVFNFINRYCKLSTLYEKYRTLSKDEMFTKEVRNLLIAVNKFIK